MQIKNPRHISTAGAIISSSLIKEVFQALDA